MFKTKELDEYINSANKSGFKQHIWGLYVLSVWVKKWLL
jgi:asparagine synthase (glutamine-hydrolysing)